MLYPKDSPQAFHRPPKLRPFVLSLLLLTFHESAAAPDPSAVVESPVQAAKGASGVHREAAEQLLLRAEQRRKCDPEALRLFQQAAAGFEQAQSPSRYGYALNQLGTCYQTLDQIETAQEHFRQALTAVRQAADHALERRVLTNLATATSSAGDLASAIEIFEQALALHRAADDPEMVARTLSNLGLSYMSRGNFDRALTTYTQARDYFVSSGQQRSLGRILAKMGNTHQALGNSELARQNLQQAIAIGRQAGDLEVVAFAGGRLATEAMDAGDYLVASHQLRVNIETARQLGRRRTEAYHSISLSQALLKLGKSREALRWAEHGLELHQQIANPWGEVAAWDDVARARYAEGDFAGALQATEQGTQRLEQQRSRIGGPDQRAAYLAADWHTVSTRVELLLAEHLRRPQAGFAERALAAHDSALSRSLLEMLDKPRLLDSNQTASTSEPPNFDLAELQNRLDEHTVVVEYALGHERSWAWVVSRSGLQLIELASSTALTQAVAELLPLTAPSDRTPVLDPVAAKKLSALVWQPLEAHLASIQQVLLVATGALLRVPFTALQDSQDNLLVDGLEFVHAPSAITALVLDKERPEASEIVRVVADPVYRPDDSRLTGQVQGEVPPSVTRAAAAVGLERLPRLRFTRREAETIAELAGPTTESQLDFAASKAALQALKPGSTGVLHIAAHTLVNDREPENSGIVLSLFDRQGLAQDGFLRLAEIEALSIDAELVVLSACSTALGKELRGEGLMSITRSFLAAGAGGVVASLWPVDDRATAELMGYFYTALWSPQRPSAPAALAIAQRRLATSERWSGAEHWSGFVYLGGLS